MAKVLFVNNCLTGGGSERAMCLIANYFSKKGFDVSMMLLVNKEKTYYVSSDIKLIECYCQLENNKLLWHLKRISTIRSAIKKVRPDVVITFMTDVNIRVNLASIGLKTYVIQSERADPNQNKYSLKRILFNLFLRMADFTVFQTKMAQDSYPRSIQKHSTIIPNAINEALPKADRSCVKKTIVSIGRLTEQKNYTLLINAFSAFYQSHKDFNLIIYGEGPLRKCLESQIECLSLSKVISLPGYSNSINEDIKDAFMYINSSNYEGISNAMLEALALGIPSVCTDCPVGGASIVIDNGINGILVPTNDLSSMVFAMSKIADDADFYETISANALLVRNTYSIDNIGKQWVDICREKL